MTMQANIGTSLLKSLISLREQKGALSIEDVGAMFEQMAKSIGNSSATDQFLRNEIEKLAQFIDTAKKEVGSFIPEGDAVNATGDAALELDAVIKHTEEASNTIMDAADAIQGAVAGIGGETETTIMNATMQIYEACNFQDLTGQRLRKIIDLLGEIDTRVNNILALFGSSGAKPANGSAKVIAPDFSDKSLLNGPQLNAPSQADIDALFASFKP